jgi:hypothetical protein
MHTSSLNVYHERNNLHLMASLSPILPLCSISDCTDKQVWSWKFELCNNQLRI